MTSLSVLDQSPICQGGTAAQAIRETLELARACERLGYHRYWLAEHHNTSGFAGSAPEILIGAVASATSRIRVGSGGVMLPHYSPLKVAEVFRMLETLYPGRIDLGLGRAPGSDPRTSAALQPGPQAYGIDVFPQQIELLVQFLEDATGLEGAQGGFPDTHPYRGIHAMPSGEAFPELWMLGSGGDGAVHAGHFGLPYCFAHFIRGEADAGPVELYRQCFRPSRGLAAPKAALAVSVVVADTEEEAVRLSAPRNFWIVQLLQGKTSAFPTPEEALAYPYNAQERDLLANAKTRSIVGAPAQVRDRLLAMGKAFGADDFVVLTITHDFKDRLRSYELLADAFSLDASACV